jgi:ferredoxin--NADP+ reductase
MKTVFVVGGGPAGLFAAQKMALAGHEVVIFNRDIKPGGLAEYGIYPLKQKMKDGLRKQFAKILGLPNVHYFGHVPVGAQCVISLEALRQMNPAARVFAVGAQGTKRLEIPGEDAGGVYSAKDFVYHYNLLPPFASRDFSTGKRIAIVGMGNVMVDIARWLLQDNPERKTEEVIVVARRGPFEAKFDEKEFAHVEMHLDRQAFHEELQRVRDRLQAVGQDIVKAPGATFPILAKPGRELVRPRLLFRFLSSPQAIHSDGSGRITRLTLTENQLVIRDGGTAAKATDRSVELDVDTMIFAIGDVVDPVVGLPCGPGGYVTNPDPSDPQRAAYEVFDPQNGKVLEGAFVVGWARKASEGLVGIARRDAEVGATHVLRYLDTVKESEAASAEEIGFNLARRGLQAVAKADLPYLAQAEERQARERGVPFFKFADDAGMLSAIEREKCKVVSPIAA